MTKSAILAVGMKKVYNLIPSYTDNLTECGCDEAGRGCLAGPVCAAAVILPKDYHHDLLTDSKKLSASQREMMAETIRKEAVAWAVTAVDASEIDSLNILQASITAMHRSIDSLIEKGFRPDLILVDGNRFRKYGNTEHVCIVGGDAKYASIAAASILAKTCRDRMMKELALMYPQYGWDRNMGYPTRDHKEAILRFGITPLHRKSFRLPVKEEMLFSL